MILGPTVRAMVFVVAAAIYVSANAAVINAEDEGQYCWGCHFPFSYSYQCDVFAFTTIADCCGPYGPGIVTSCQDNGDPQNTGCLWVDCEGGGTCECLKSGYCGETYYGDVPEI
jgi:hypothetical protein